MSMLQRERERERVISNCMYSKTGLQPKCYNEFTLTAKSVSFFFYRNCIKYVSDIIYCVYNKSKWLHLCTTSWFTVLQYWFLSIIALYCVCFYTVLILFSVGNTSAASSYVRWAMACMDGSQTPPSKIYSDIMHLL